MFWKQKQREQERERNKWNFNCLWCLLYINNDCITAVVMIIMIVLMDHITGSLWSDPNSGAKGKSCLSKFLIKALHWRQCNVCVIYTTTDRKIIGPLTWLHRLFKWQLNMAWWWWWYSCFSSTYILILIFTSYSHACELGTWNMKRVGWRKNWCNSSFG